MALLTTKHEKRSFIITTILMVLLLFALFHFGLAHLDPKPENGIAVNLGYSDTGSGTIQPLEPMASSRVKPVVEKTPTPVNTPEPVAEPVEKQEVLTSNTTEDAPVLPTTKKKKKTTIKKAVKTPTTTKKVVEKKVTKPSKSTTDALSNLLNGNATGNATTSQGDDANGVGDKGKSDGNPYASTYYNSAGGGSGSGAGYGLNGRSLLSNGKVQQDCNQEGTVVVKIEVDKNGKVISATPGVRGTTNNDPCLLAPAKKTAFSHRWNLDANAPNRQIGFVVVKFKLGE